MTESQRITEPSSLSDITIGLYSLNIEIPEPSHSESRIQHVKLVLLQPLANADMLAVCRNPGSRFLRNQDGVIVGPSNHEWLNILPLSKAWRQAVTKAAPIPQVTFDLTLPKRDENTSTFQPVYWETSMPEEGGLGLVTRDVMTLVITLATGMRMRANGDLRFELIYNKSDGVRTKAMESLKKQLLALAQYKAPVKDGQRGDQDSVE